MFPLKMQEYYKKNISIPADKADKKTMLCALMVISHHHPCLKSLYNNGRACCGLVLT